MIPKTLGRPFRARAAVALAAVLAVLATACQPGPSFSAEGPCTVDGRAAGAYPELEALVPRVLAGTAPTVLDSGRTCSDRGLGTLKGRGVSELRFAGATWDEGDGAGTTIAALATPPEAAVLEPDLVAEFYEAGARSSSKTSNTTVSHPTMGAAGQVWRLDTLNDLSQQTIVLRALGDAVQVVLVATRVGPDASLDEHNARVDRAVEVAATIEPTNAGGAVLGAVLPSAR